MPCCIRAVLEHDTEALRAIYAPLVEGTAVSFEVEGPGPEEWRRRVLDTAALHPFLVAEEEGVVLGYAYGGPHRARPAYRFSVEVSVYVAAEARRRGVGRALYEALFLLLERQGFRNVYAGIALPNEASIRLHESLGFEAVGVFRRVGYKLGAWHDTGWYQRPLTTDPGPPSEPRTIEQLWSDPGLAAELDRCARSIVDP